MSQQHDAPTMGRPAAAEPTAAAAGTPADPGRYQWPQRIVAIVLMLLAILVAGGIAGAANALDESDDRLYTDVEPGETIRIGADATLRITGVSLGGNLTERDALVASSGRYVLVEYEVAAGTEEATTVRVELRVDGRTYREVDTSYEPLPPGFAGNRASLFEVPPEVLTEDVELVFGKVELVYSHQHWARWRPTFTADEVSRSELMSVTLPETKMWVVG